MNSYFWKRRGAFLSSDGIRNLWFLFFRQVHYQLHHRLRYVPQSISELEKQCIIRFYLPSGYIFRIFTITGTICITNLENGTDRATIFSSLSFQTDVVFSAIFRMGVSTEWTSIAEFTGSRAWETSCNLCKLICVCNGKICPSVSVNLPIGSFR